jgi:MFS_1 like family
VENVDERRRCNRGLRAGRAAGALAASARRVRWSVTAVTAWLPAMALVEPPHGLTFTLLHLACMQMLSAVVPPALAATAQAIYGTVAVGAMTAIPSLVSGPLYGAFGARALWAMALLCAAALPIAFAMRRISINAYGSKPVQPAPVVARRRAVPGGNCMVDVRHWSAIRHQRGV